MKHALVPFGDWQQKISILSDIEWVAVQMIYLTFFNPVSSILVWLRSMLSLPRPTSYRPATNTYYHSVDHGFIFAIIFGNTETTNHSLVKQDERHMKFGTNIWCPFNYSNRENECDHRNLSIISSDNFKFCFHK